MKRAIFHPEAEEEFSLAVVFYAEERPGLAQDFADAVDQAVAFVRGSPQAGPYVGGGNRRWLVRRFPYSIVYREEPDRIYILAVAHQRRHPDYWEKRV